MRRLSRPRLRSGSTWPLVLGPSASPEETDAEERGMLLLGRSRADVEGEMRPKTGSSEQVRWRASTGVRAHSAVSGNDEALAAGTVCVNRGCARGLGAWQGLSLGASACEKFGYGKGHSAGLDQAFHATPTASASQTHAIRTIYIFQNV